MSGNHFYYSGQIKKEFYDPKICQSNFLFMPRFDCLLFEEIDEKRLPRKI